MAIACNTQAPEAIDHNKTGALRVHKVFLTIQGEGPYAGRRAVFIRLSGCNLQCPFCDTDYTSVNALMTLREIVSRVDSLFSTVEPRERRPLKDLVVITGGEPFRQRIGPLIKELAGAYLVQIESNGTIRPDDEFDPHSCVVVCSPKTPKLNEWLAPRVNAYKYVLDADHVAPDGLPAGTLGKYNQTARPPADWVGDVFVQPMDAQDERLNRRHLEATVQSSLRFGYRLCIQNHKLAGLE